MPMTAPAVAAPNFWKRTLAGDAAGRPCESQLIHITAGFGKTAD